MFIEVPNSAPGTKGAFEVILFPSSSLSSFHKTCLDNCFGSLLDFGNTDTFVFRHGTFSELQQN